MAYCGLIYNAMDLIKADSIFSYQQAYDRGVGSGDQVNSAAGQFRPVRSSHDSLFYRHRIAYHAFSLMGTSVSASIESSTAISSTL